MRRFVLLEKNQNPKMRLTPFMPLPSIAVDDRCVVPLIFRFEILGEVKMEFAENRIWKLGRGKFWVLLLECVCVVGCESLVGHLSIA